MGSGHCMNIVYDPQKLEDFFKIDSKNAKINNANLYNFSSTLCLPPPP